MLQRAFLTATVAAVMGWLVGAGAAAGQGDKGHDHHAHFMKCAKACADCMNECSSCQTHCARLVAEGKKDHQKPMQLCADCADVCALAARVSARQGPMAVPVCEGCAKACDVCAEACEKHPQDKHMAQCAKACRDCAKECRAMVKHVGHDAK